MKMCLVTGKNNCGFRKGFDRSFTVHNSITPVGFWIPLETCHGWTKKKKIYAEFALQNGSESRSADACLRTERFGDFITDRPTESKFSAVLSGPRSTTSVTDNGHRFSKVHNNVVLKPRMAVYRTLRDKSYRSCQTHERFHSMSKVKFLVSTVNFSRDMISLDFQDYKTCRDVI